jgi:hypothetical protein
MRSQQFQRVARNMLKLLTTIGRLLIRGSRVRVPDGSPRIFKAFVILA